MAKMIFSQRQVNNYFAKVRRAWMAIKPGDAVKYIQNGQVQFGRVLSLWGGQDPRLVVSGLHDGKMHYFRTLDGIMVFSRNKYDYIPATEYGSQK